jgi:K+-sensing histidine kinase KdpD
MQQPIMPENEKQRLEALYEYKILDTIPEDEYDNITKIAAEICGTPIALVSLVDPNRQWFKSHYGIEVEETPRELAFCAHAINFPDELFIISDATKDDRFKDNPIVNESPNIVFYAGAPLKTSEGYVLGTLCVIDSKPRVNLTQSQQEILKALAKQVVSNFELRKKNRQLKILNAEMSRMNDQLNHFNYLLSNDLKTPIHGIGNLVNFIKESYAELIKDTEINNWIDLIFDRVIYMDSLINGITNYIRVTNCKIEFNNFNFAELIDDILVDNNLKLKIDLNLDGCDVMIKHTKKGIKQIFKNLLSNSIKFKIQPTSSIWISIKEDNDNYYFTYEDNGPGISNEDYKKIFQLFQINEKSNPKNHGIGLATIKAIIDRCGGKLSLSKRAQNKSGVLFQFSLLKENINK